MNKRVFHTDQEWLGLIQECRSSGLSDKAWCEANNIASAPVFLWLSTAFWYNKGIENVYHYLTYLLEKFPTSETSDDELEQALGISGVLSEACSWACKKDTANGVHGSQIDLVIVRKDQVIDLCEMKFSGKEYTITAKAEEGIRRKASEFLSCTGTRYAIHTILVTPYGIAAGSYAGSIQNVITTDDFFA